MIHVSDTCKYFYSKLQIMIDDFTQVEGKHDTHGYFYLSESLNENDDCTFWISKEEQDSIYGSPQALPDTLNNNYG